MNPSPTEITGINPAAAHEPTPKKRILVVDDDLTASQLLRMALEQTGRFELRVENKSGRAVAAAREFQPDCVVLDVCMPGQTGGDVAAEMRRDPRLSRLPIVFLTSIVSEREASAGPLQSGGYPLLAKPVNMNKLLAVMEKLLAANR